MRKNVLFRRCNSNFCLLFLIKNKDLNLTFCKVKKYIFLLLRQIDNYYIFSITGKDFLFKLCRDNTEKL